jgi:hypothetical protein
MNPAFLLLAALLLPISPAMAGNWHALLNTSQELLEAGEPQLETSEDNAQDKSRKKDKKLKVWDKITFSRPEQARPGDFYYASAKSLLAINCTKRTHKLLQKIYYAADGQEIKSVYYGEDEKIKFSVPDSAEERVLNFSCAFKVAKTDNKTPRRVQTKSAEPKEKSSITSKVVQKPEVKADSNSKSSTPTIPPATKPKGSAAEKPKL